MKPFYNPLKHILKAGKKTAGAWLQIASPLTAEIMGQAGFDWLIIDMEHGPGDILSLTAQLQAVNASETVPIVRAPWNDFVILKRILDAGAYGVLIPYINNRSEAEAAVRACLYPPEGIRGVAGSPRAAGFGQNSMNYLTRANDEIFIMTAVETMAGVENIADILSVDRLDGIFIGPMDLSSSVGHMGNAQHPEVKAAIASVEETVLASGKILATIAGNWDQAKQLYERGYQMIMLMADGVGLGKLAAEKVAEFRTVFPEG